MSNTLDLLSQQLAVALRDETYTTWDSEEMDRLITWSVASLWPRFKREFAPQTNTLTLVTSTYFYSLPTGMLRVSYVDWVDSSSNELGTLDPGSWSVEGPEGSAKLHIAPNIADQGGTLRLLGYGRYDTTTNYIPDDLVPLVLAMARAEAYRRMAGSRVQFTNWLASNQSANVTVNELFELIREANAEIVRLQRQSNGRTWSRPVPGRRG